LLDLGGCPFRRFWIIPAQVSQAMTEIQQPWLVSFLPPSPTLRRAALAVSTFLLVAFVITIPFTEVMLPRLNIYIPLVATVMFLNDLITASLLLVQFSIARSRTLLFLANGYLFTALVAAVYGLVWPGAFHATGLFGAGPETPPWLYLVWHAGLPTSIIVYALLKSKEYETPPVTRNSVRTFIFASITCNILIVCGLTWFVTRFHDVLPILVTSVDRASAFSKFGTGAILIVSTGALVLQWRGRRRSVLDLWLSVVTLAWLLGSIMLTAIGARYDVAWYATPGFLVVSAMPVLLVLLSESSILHAQFDLELLLENKRAEEELRRSEAYLAEAQKLSQTGSWAWNPDQNIRYWSQECYRVLSFDPRDGLPRFEEFFQRIHPDDQPGFRELIQAAIREKAQWEADYRIVHPDGPVRDIHSTGHPVLSASGDLIELVGTVIDITERKRAEEELRASERKYRHLVDTTPAFVHTALPNGDVDFYNRGWLEYVGLPLTDLLGWGWTCMIHPEDVEELVAKWRAALESGKAFVAEARVRRADGEYRWFLHREEPLRDRAGEIVKWYGSSIEIEERKIAEEKIREQETELRQILDLTPQHIGVLGPDGSRLYANQTALEYFGITLEQWRDQKAHMEHAHPEDREHFRAERNKRFLEGKPHEFEARLLRHDNEFRCFLFRLTPIKDERGHITRWYGTATDIEDRKRAEEKIRKENIALREEIIKVSMFEEIVGNSPVLQQVLIRVAKVAPTDSTVLVTGETGTGKELIARAIHKASKRSDRAFVSVNCAAIPPSLIPSELFGHEKGAFTGAIQRRLGRFELAEGGTIFLDEVGELPPETQVALLRVLQEREFERVGGNKSIRANVRVIVATNRDLQAAIAAGTFREDLFYRLNVFPIEIPPLRKREEDIPLLVQYFIDRYAREAGKNIWNICKETLDLFQSYPWPGNIRELRNVIERSVIVCETESFSVDESWLSRQPLRTSPTSQRELRQRVAAEEREAIEAALTESGGRVYGPSGAAAKLGIARSTLESKIKILEIDKNRFKVSNPS
jgi:formate hydrogenlyase transcriptional activator